MTVSQQRNTESFDLTGTGGPGYRVTVTSQQLQEVNGYQGHAELDLSATVHLLDDAGQPAGDAVPLFDLVLGDVRMDCAEQSPSPSPSGTPTQTTSASPSGSPSQSPSASPSESASGSPSASPSESPSGSPSQSPSQSPSASGSTSEGPSASPSRTTPAAPGQGGNGTGQPPVGGPGPSLPITGTSLTALVGGALLCIGVAAALLVLARRRRT